MPSRGGGYVIAPTRSVVIAPTAPSRPGVTTVATVTGRGRLRLAPKDVIESVLVSQHNADLKRLLLISWFVLAITAVASGLLGWLAAGRVLRPLRSMSDKARTISAGNLEERLALAGPDDEFKQLGDTFDELLARLDSAFEAQRRFVANASHELRTPLTLDRALLQMALSDPDAAAGTFRATCEELLTSNRDQERLLEALLTLAVSERGLEQREPVALEAVAGRVAARFAGEAERHQVALELELGEAPTTGDPALIERLVANLVDNAIRYNHVGGRVALVTAAHAGRAELRVTNTGPTIAAGEEEALFQPFRRLDSGRPAVDDGHHGLGLSIVRAIATSHGATVAAVPGAGGGLEVRVSFPRE